MVFQAIHIKGEKFHLGVADTPELQTQGLSGVKSLSKHRGMIFIFHEPMYVRMVMKDMNFPLDFLYLDENWNILQTDSLAQDDTQGSTTQYPTSLVIELPYGTITRLGLQEGDNLSPEENMKTQVIGVQRFKHGGKFEIVGEKVYEIKVDDIIPEKGRLQILNELGEVVANVDPGCTIFSREHTDELIKKFKSNDTIGLADSILKILDIHDNQGQEYVRN